MELLEIRSAHDLTAHVPETRRAGKYSYLISCRQFMSVLGNWRRANAAPGNVADGSRPVSFMTMSADQIWVTEPEINKIVAAIESGHSPLSLS